MTLQQQASDLIYDLPDDSIHFIIELIKRLNPTAKTENVAETGTGLVMGIAKDMFIVNDEIFDSSDSEIEKMFGESA